MTRPLLFQPIEIRGVTARNRVVIPPMCMYSAVEGLPQPFHHVHLGQFALGGAGIVFVEASAVEPRGRITHGDVGIWSDTHAEALKPIAGFLKHHGAVAAIQIAHAGRKASMQRPWHGNARMDETDEARGERPWDVVGPSDTPFEEGWLVPSELSKAEIAELVGHYAAAAKRAVAAGFDVVEIHGAHGYLIQSFLSPVSNTRSDEYGGEREGRMRFALEVAEAVRAALPEDTPLFFRISSIDSPDVGWQIEDSVALAKELKTRGVDVIDCSSGGVSLKIGMVPRELGFQVPFAAQVRREAGIASMAVGLILSGEQGEDILQRGDADLIAVAREALNDPFWAHHAARELHVDPPFDYVPEQYGWWLKRRESALARIRANAAE
jgi:2,4-dienoyl-CoA reductase-like NADH-dependent reductase (Old Yellow Enzyme family)